MHSLCDTINGCSLCVLQFVLTVGTVVLGLFIASRVLGIEWGGKPGQPKSGRGGKWGSGRCVLGQR